MKPRCAPFYFHRLQVFCVILLVGLAASLQAADLKLASFFGDHMVLQRDRKIPVWGVAESNAMVVVTIATQRTTTTAGIDGRWQTDLASMPAGGPYTLMVASGNKTTSLKDVLFGDVWLCSGQSNMQMPVKECVPAEQDATVTNRPELRLCTVPKGWNGKPQTSADIKWATCTPDSARNFSAVAYFFASELLKDSALKNVPIGVIDSSFGGTTCEGWIPQSALADFSTNDLHNSMFGIKPAMLYNSMIAPLGEAALKGVIWYQGESNSGHPDTYVRLLTTMIAEWREQFEQPELPFFIIQLPDYASQWDGFYWPWEREAQAKVVQSTPNTALVVGIDTTDGFNLHPKQKLEIGRRTALLVRRNVYHENIVARGPIFKNASVAGSTIRVTFDTGGDGLTNSATGAIRGFAIAGEHGAYRFANATIEGDTVILQCPQVRSPKTVRYAWAGVPDSNLVNHSGLPAAPFRTDNLSPDNIEVQREPVSHQVTTSAYHISIDGNGMVTSLITQGAQFISNEPGMAGGTSIPVMFGSRQLSNIQNLGPKILACSDNNVTLLFKFQEKTMDWILTNSGKDEIKFNIALSPQAVVDRQSDSAVVTVTRKKSSFTIDGIDSISDSEDGKVLHVVVKGGTSKQLSLNLGGN